MAQEDYEERIRQRAHAIWEREGRPHGRHLDHWDQAQREEVPSTSAIAAGTSVTPGGTMTPDTSTVGSPAGKPGTPSGSSSLVGADDVGTGVPDAMGVDDLNVAGRVSDPKDTRPTTGRSKLVGS